MYTFSDEVDSVLRQDGWEPGRRVDVAEWMMELERNGIRVQTAAREFLAEFAGLKVGVTGPGTSRARLPFDLNPLECGSEEDRFLEWSEDVGCRSARSGYLMAAGSSWAWTSRV
jgi:hypothetical protein